VNDDSLSEFVLRNRSGSYERRAWRLDSTGQPAEAALIFLDAELYIGRVQAPTVVRRLQTAGVIPAVKTLFVSHNGPDARHSDFVCNPDYAAFVANEVVGWVRNECPGVRDIVIAGLSLSGLAAAFIASRHPSVFRAAVCQSPSFWWEGGRFAEDLPPAAGAPEFWLCVGDKEAESGVSHPPSGLRQELTQIEGCDRAAAAFRREGYAVSYRLYDGGHDPECWREDLALALPWVWRRG